MDVIVSHIKKTLELNGKTIAILPSTLDNIIPKENIKLANEIVNNTNNQGLLISEYFYSSYDKYEFIGRFIERDRLQALYSNLVILCASYSEKDTKEAKNSNSENKDSGSRHAMKKAKEYNIKRAVIYDEEENKINGENII